MRTASVVSGLLVTLLLAACPSRKVASLGTGGPDLTPLRWNDLAGPVAYCKTSAQGLVVGILNRGDQPAEGRALVRFHYATPGGSSPTTVGPLDFGTIPAGASVSRPFAVPTPVPAGDYGFTIEVDPGQQVDETNESNNQGTGHCIT